MIVARLRDLANYNKKNVSFVYDSQDATLYIVGPNSNECLVDIVSKYPVIAVSTERRTVNAEYNYIYGDCNINVQCRVNIKGKEVDLSDYLLRKVVENTYCNVNTPHAKGAITDIIGNVAISDKCLILDNDIKVKLHDISENIKPVCKSLEFDSKDLCSCIYSSLQGTGYMVSTTVAGLDPSGAYYDVAEAAFVISIDPLLIAVSYCQCRDRTPYVINRSVELTVLVEPSKKEEVLERISEYLDEYYNNVPDGLFIDSNKTYITKMYFDENDNTINVNISGAEINVNDVVKLKVDNLKLPIMFAKNVERIDDVNSYELSDEYWEYYSV